MQSGEFMRMLGELIDGFGKANEEYKCISVFTVIRFMERRLRKWFCLL